MTLHQFTAAGESLSKRAGVLDGLHGYFRSHATRLYRTCGLFGLFSAKLGDVLEIGPFYGYTPFLLRQQSSSYTLLEGNDPAVLPLAPLYRQENIGLNYVDFFEMFGPTRTAPHALPLADSSYDTILCWETMEHFNFNPVKFVRELHRVLKPGGRVCITVPNRASLQHAFVLLSGRGEKAGIDSYFQVENYVSDGKKAFYGFHWREYSAAELSRLFAGVGFKIQAAGSFIAFRDHEHLGPGRRLARFVQRMATACFPRYGTNVYLIASK
ncbi:MAG: methyltransferase domain-containing protein [Limisphaerales bacterium]